MFKIDFFNVEDENGCEKLISEYFEINYYDVCEVLSDYYLNYNKSYSLNDLKEIIQKLGINLKYDYESETYLKCRHAMTAYDGLNLLREKGLLNLKDMIEQKTPLSNFLEENDIIIDINKKILKYRGVKYKILSTNEKCENCIFEKATCISRNIFTYKGCKYRDKLNFLHVKLYHDKCETEVFISGEISDIYKYTTVRHSPEILYTIDNIIYFYDNKKIDLVSKWADTTNSKYYILEFYVRYEDFEFLSNNIKYDGYYEIREIAEMFDYNSFDYEENNISPIFYKNLYIFSKLVDIYMGNNSKECKPILPNVLIKGEDIKVIREHDNNYKAPEEL